jgi:hypothetical protein
MRVYHLQRSLIETLLVLWHPLMRAMLGVKAGSGEAQPLHGATMEEMLGDNFLNILQMNEAIPNGLGIDHHRRAMLALIEAAGFVGPNQMLEASVLDGILEGGFQLLAAERQAAWTGRRFVALIGTDKDMMFKFRHGGVSCSWSRFATADRAGSVAF